MITVAYMKAFRAIPVIVHDFVLSVENGLMAVFCNRNNRDIKAVIEMNNSRYCELRG